MDADGHRQERRTNGEFCETENGLSIEVHNTDMEFFIVAEPMSATEHFGCKLQG
jgi:hypothetical protein